MQGFKRFRYPLLGSLLVSVIAIIYVNFKVQTIGTPTPTVNFFNAYYDSDRYRELTADITAPATESDYEITLSNEFPVITLPSNSTITKRIIIEGDMANGLTLDCNGSTIKQTAYGTSYYAMIIRYKSSKRPENITVENCNIDGRVTLKGASVTSN